jgi:superfamily II DNA or RNA helicase
MSISSHLNNISNEQREKINNELKITIQNKFGPPKYIYPYDLDDEDNLTLPFAYGATQIKIPRKKREEFTNFKIKFTGQLRPEQQEIKKEAINILNKLGSIIISLYTGGGKTITSINIAASIGFKILVIVNKLVLIKQWEESINNFCPDAIVQKLTPKSILNEDAHFYIVNAINVPKFTKNFFSDIGTLIIDESHLILAETLSKSLHCIQPRYLIALSATPYRVDGLNQLFDLYFGPYKVVRQMYRQHTVYKIETGFRPEVEISEKTGRINWGVVLDSQANDENRNNLIVKISKKFSNRNILILTKRITQAEYLYKKILESGEYVTSLFGSNQEFDKNARILIGTTSKCSTGFDHAKLDTLILSCDMDQYFMQSLGRIFRVPDNEPIVFDLVDNNPILKKHYKSREEVYKSVGGIIKNFDINKL